MSILIKGMKMPTSCRSCRFAGFGGRRCELNVCIFTGESQPTLSQKRMSACPLVTVPPHGRLIDADALADVFRGFIAMYDSCSFSKLSLPEKSRRDELQSALAEVINASTILEAEDGE